MTAFKAGDPTTLNRLYGRSSGHKLRASQAELVETLLPAIAIPESGEISAERLFGQSCPLHLEIGFGGGEHLAYRADLLPDHGFIGCEPFLNGVAQALAHVRDQQLANVRIHMGDALEVLRRVADGALTMVYLLHPDPWPKARHAKRRMMNDGPLDLIAAKLRQGGELRVATDDPTYLNWALMVMQRHAHQFEWLVSEPGEWERYPSGWLETRYAAKARRQGRMPHQFRYRRLGEPGDAP
ncbi:tRNA (guanine(46)-N(7))-methyltransferase TrmB [Sphingomonas xanthus]|uniref:tRNA (guanine-N(7)-)-methyltransferase n=1 Tax=Sphingomonas xanthus TaxID=2594473 RepID=A0A516ISV6_9SPHN|nr:tRNA (guanine(46)-N(7))-methyltransferase TrmB [Sphingomonas xanthus]QDP19973.1 tRNA (guanosine(46)-N7)-methyltransferase TrmB [Sphingomonas xanthus]